MSAPAQPIFILAAPYSGASSLAAMLGRHPQVCAVPELNLFMAGTVEELLEIFRISQGAHADGLLRAIAKLEFGAQTDANIAQARDWLAARATWTTGKVAQHLAMRAAPRVLVVPDAESPLRPMDLRRLRTQLPEARILHLVRHPYTQGLLLAHSLAQRLFVPPDFKDHSVDPPRADPQIPWLRSNTNILRAISGFDGALRCRSEDVVADPARELRRIAQWLGIELRDADVMAMQSPEHWEFAGYGPAAAPYGLEAEVLEAFPDELIARAQRDAVLRNFSAEVISMARELGYST